MSEEEILSIDIERFRKALGPFPKADFIAAPSLEWLPIDRLRVDRVYQREVFGRGQANILRIARNFAWHKFSTVIVVPDQKLYLIVDGQHRTAAAAIRGINKVPCQIINVTRAQAAEAFAAINGGITAITPAQLFAAKLAAGDPDAHKIASICAKSGVKILRYPTSATEMKPGETMAIGMIQRMHKQFGRDVLTSGLSCITSASPHPGVLRAPIIEALCSVIEGDPDACSDLNRLIRIMKSFDFRAMFVKASQKAIAERCKIASILVDMIGLHIERNTPRRASA